jgi:hypothetical protein
MNLHGVIDLVGPQVLKDVTPKNTEARGSIVS